MNLNNRIKKEWKENKFESENQFQAACVKMISQEFPKLRGKFFHPKNENYIPKNKEEEDTWSNGGKERYARRAMIEAGRFKAMGLLPGVMDVLIVHNGILYKIELKLPKRGLNDAQKELHDIWNADCPEIPVMICYTIEEVFLYCKHILDKNFKISFYAQQ